MQNGGKPRLAFALLDSRQLLRFASHDFGKSVAAHAAFFARLNDDLAKWTRFFVKFRHDIFLQGRVESAMINFFIDLFFPVLVLAILLISFLIKDT